MSLLRLEFEYYIFYAAMLKVLQHGTLFVIFTN